MKSHNRYRLLKSFSFAIHGIDASIRTQPNLRVHVAIACLAILMGVLCNISTVEWLSLSISIFFVLVTEMMNTAIESTIDLVQPDVHPLAKRSKDIAAGAVLLAVCNALIVGYLLFFHRFVTLVFTY